MVEKAKFYSLIGLGVLIGIVIVSTIKHGEIYWISIGKASGVAVILFISYLFINKGLTRVEQE